MITQNTLMLLSMSFQTSQKKSGCYVIDVIFFLIDIFINSILIFYRHFGNYNVSWKTKRIKVIHFMPMNIFCNRKKNLLIQFLMLEQHGRNACMPLVTSVLNDTLAKFRPCEASKEHPRLCAEDDVSHLTRSSIQIFYFKFL